MRTLKLKCLFLFTICLFLSFSSTSFSQLTYIEVVPSGGSEDAENIQSALDAVDAGGTVHLIAGIFDFQRQWVEIDKPCTLEGETDANGNLLTTILNGGSAVELMEAIAIFSGGVTVKNLNFDGLELFGVFVYYEANGDVVIIQNNHFGNLPKTDWSFPIGCSVNQCPVEILDNTIGTSYLGLFLGRPSGEIKVIGNNITDCMVGVMLLANNCPVTIHDNDIHTHLEGIWGRSPYSNNPTVNIKNNKIFIYSGWGVYLYNSFNFRVEENIFRSVGSSVEAGVIFTSGCRNNIIVNNDFSELTTWDTQILLLGENNLVEGNIFGPSKGEGPNLSYRPTAVVLMSIGSDPTFNCTLMNNDYRGCQLPGWSYDEIGNLMGGCVLILNNGNGVYNNLVNETGRFPEGTGGPKKQVVEIPDPNVYNNRVIGHRANEIAYLEDEYPGIGQRIKESREDMMLISHIFEGLGDTVKFMGKGSPNKLIHNNKMDDLEDFLKLIPKSYVLFQNYPNPFNPSTNIKFSLPKTGVVKLSIYDTLGKEVAVLVNAMVETGFSEVSFNALNLPSGIYFYRLQAGDFIQTKKMVLLK